MSARDAATAVSRPDKVLFPDAGITKADLAGYYADVADDLLRHARGRPLTLFRRPDGIDAEGFVQKRAPEHRPEGMPIAEVALADGGTIAMCLAEDSADLEWLADQACCEIHVWTARVDRPREPDRLVVDLDPPGEDFAAVRDAALLLRARLDECDAPAYPLLTGGRGMHVVVPLRRGPDHDRVRAVATALAEHLVAARSEDYTVAARKARRGGRLYLDVTRNAYAQTTVCPYSPRARPGAPVATPLAWDEVDADLAPGRWHVGNIRRRLGQRDDPWGDFPRHAIELENLVERLRTRLGVEVP